MYTSITIDKPSERIENERSFVLLKHYSATEREVSAGKTAGALSWFVASWPRECAFPRPGITVNGRGSKAPTDCHADAEFRQIGTQPHNARVIFSNGQPARVWPASVCLCIRTKSKPTNGRVLLFLLRRLTFATRKVTICRDIGRETFAFRFDFWRRRAGFAYKGVKEGPTFALTLGSSSGYFGKVVWGRDRMEDVNLN